MPGRSRPLEGREHERSVLVAELDRARAGEGGVVLLSGEPGIGKSALLEDLAATARSRGTCAVWGTCWDGDGAPELWPWQRLLDQLGHRLDLSADDDVGRFALFARVTHMLVDAAPLLVVLDDLQWADAACVRLVRYAARELRTTGVLVAAAFRTSDVAGPLRDMVGDTAVRRHLALTGLDEPAIAAVLAADTGAEPDSREVASIASRTGGNPFFVRQLAGSTPGRLPAAVDEAVAARVDSLPPGDREVLRTAAVVGRRFEDVLLASACDRVVDLGPAIVAGIVEADVPGSHRFVHDLVREHLVASLDDADSRRVHAAVAHALAASPDVEMRTGRLAHHGPLAVPEIGAADAAAWCREAADEAAAAHAFDDVARHLRAAARLDADPATRLDLADALLRGGHRDEARETYRSVRADDPSTAARVALGLHESGVPIEQDHRDVVAALEEARLVLTDAEPLLRARVTAALARELADGPLVDRDRADSLAASALTLARSSGDAVTISACLYARHDVVWGPGTAGERAELGAELADVARSAGDRGLAFEGLLCRYVALVELGDVRAATAITELGRVAEETGQPYLAYLAASRRDGWDLMRGACEEDRLRRTFELGQRIEVPDAYGVYATQLLTLDLMRLDPGRIVTRHEELGNTVMPPDFEAEERAWELLGRGDLDGAREAIEAATPPEQRSLFRWRALAAVAIAVEIAHRTRSRDTARAAYDVLLPYAGTVVVIGGGVSVVGPVDLYLALCAEVLGDDGSTRRHAEQGRMVAQRLGAGSWVDRLTRLLDRRTSAVFRREGQVWLLEIGGVIAHLPHHKGLADLAVLLARPGEEVSALELIGGAPQLGSDPVLDQTAKAAYRARLAELDDEMRTTGDVTHLDALESERDAILDELASATGLGGRSRRLGDPGERARSTVTARIRDVLRRLDVVHPALAEHLRASVRTGRRCSYRPDSPVDWSL